MMRRETLRVGKIRNPSLAEGHSNFRFSSFQALACVCVSVCASSRTARYCLRVCVRATKSERLKRTVTCSFERTVSRKSLFFCESDLIMICARDLFSREKKSKKKGKQNCKKSFLGANFLGETLDFSSDDSYENSSFSPQF